LLESSSWRIDGEPVVDPLIKYGAVDTQLQGKDTWGYV
jgi:hypothetical protein